MIATRTPFRISLAGGGSDFRCFYNEEPGHVVSVTIAKYMYIFVHPFFERKIQVKYSKTELVESIDDIQHPIVREVMRKFWIPNLDINSIADVPAGTGLGSSSSFTVGLLQALYAYQGIFVTKERLAHEACEVEIGKLGEPIGKQDQYAAAYGGINSFYFNSDESVKVEPIVMSPGVMKELEDRLLMFYTGKVRNARTVLESQVKNIESNPGVKAEIRGIARLANELKGDLNNGNINNVGKILKEGWERKKKMSSRISRPDVDLFYSRALASGAEGGKLLGAGNGGFMLFYCLPENQSKLREGLEGLQEMQCNFDTLGAKIIYSSESDAIERIPWADTHVAERNVI